MNHKLCPIQVFHVIVSATDCYATVLTAVLLRLKSPTMLRPVNWYVFIDVSSDHSAPISSLTA
jgi:hypothetical protein